jgi:hypothetical protein
LVQKRGHQIIFYPKYHCELNWIEMVWGRVKQKVRGACDYTLAGLTKNVPAALAAVNAELRLLRRYARKAARYMSAYREGATGLLADFAVKKYRGHRCLPPSWYMDIKDDFELKTKEEACLEREPPSASQPPPPAEEQPAQTTTPPSSPPRKKYRKLYGGYHNKNT